MIRVTVVQILVLYLMGILAVLGAIWTGTEIMRKRRERKARKYKVCCTICGVIYKDESEEELPKCPVCGSLNERARIQEI